MLRLHKPIFAQTGGNLAGFGFVAPLKNSLVLDRGTGSPTFTRASVATVWGYGPTANLVDGQTLLSVASGEARFTGARRISEGVWSSTFADGSAIPDSTLKGYLAEGARKNCVLYSSGGTTSWTSSAALTANYANAVGLSFVRFVQAAPNDYALPALSGIENGAVAISAFFKQDGASAGTFNFTLWDAAHGAAFSAAITVAANGVISAVQSSGTLLGCEHVGDGVYRVSGTGTDNFATDGATIYVMANSSIASVLFGGVQWEAGSFPSSYIPTTTAAVTRAADVLTYPASGNVSGTVGTAYAEITTNLPTLNGTGIVSTYAGSGGVPLASLSDDVSIYDGAGYRQSTSVFTLSPTTSNKVATSWSSSACAGASAGTVTAISSFDGDLNIGANMAIGSNVSPVGAELFGNIRNVRIAPYAVSDARLASMTS